MACFDYDIVKEGEERVLRINCDECTFTPSLEDNDIVMSKTFDIILEVGQVTRLIYHQKRDYEYDFDQVKLLLGLVSLYKDLIERNVLSFSEIYSDHEDERIFPERFAELRKVFNKYKGDPIGAYVELRNQIRHQNLKIDATVNPRIAQFLKRYVEKLGSIQAIFDSNSFFRLITPYIKEFREGERDLYIRIFRPSIKPDFMFTKLMAAYPPEGKVLDSYVLGETEVTIFDVPNDVKTLYHIVPPEFKLDEEKYSLLDEARRILSEHKPTRREFTDPERVREVFYNVGRDLLKDISQQRGSMLNKAELDEMTEILVRYTIGFGLIEVLLADQNIQDVSVNSPMGNITIFIVHAIFGDCYTNIIPTIAEGESWATKLRLISGRPLDEANPVLDTELHLPGARTRVAAVTEPLNPTGVAFSFRRHRDKPCTLALLVKSKALNAMAAGMISFFVDGARTILVAGTRSSGKTSLLGAVLVEIMRRYRIITVEDTLELPSEALRRNGYNIQNLKVASILSRGETEVDATAGIRTTLRLGDSALIVGEVRSKEAIALYEAMRVGAAANVVAGTIHGDSPYGVFDRVVNDIGVPRTSFKATDIIIIVNPIVSPDGLHKIRRVLRITEVRKTWEDDPLTENGFVDLMRYNPETDQLELTPDLLNGDSQVLKDIAAKIKDFAGSWDAVWDNINLRAKVKQKLVDVCIREKDDELVEAEFTILSNDRFHEIMEEVREDKGFLDNDLIFQTWELWLEKEVKRRKVEKYSK